MAVYGIAWSCDVYCALNSDFQLSHSGGGEKRTEYNIPELVFLRNFKKRDISEKAESLPNIFTGIISKVFTVFLLFYSSSIGVQLYNETSAHWGG
jgi:hypothetical protein